MMTTTPQSQQQPPPLDVIPDSLLALAKDSRYVKECQSLFLQVLSTLLPRRRHQLLEQESWILASLLCLGMMRHTANGTTLGMEAVGLQFPSNASRWKFVLMALATFSWAYAFSSERQRNAAGDRPAITSSPEENDERLQGLSRREFHERQRQAMLQRASQASGYGTNETNNINSNNTTQSSAAAARENTQNQDDDFSLHNSLRRKIKLLAHQLAQISSSTILAIPEGPHTLVGETQQHLQQQQQQSSSSIANLGRWLAKLQLAHFCLTGRYPSWLHRLSGHPIVASSSSASKLYHRPTTARLIGLLIGAQATTALVQAGSSALSYWLAQQRQQRQFDASSNTNAPPSPLIEFFNGESEASKQNSIGQQETKSICAICGMPRTHPAAPSSCGHIACWNCLIQWVSTIRPECPLCRAACRPQDVIALHNYEPTI